MIMGSFDRMATETAHDHDLRPLDLHTGYPRVAACSMSEATALGWDT